MNEEFEFSDESYFVSNIQDYFEHIFKKMLKKPPDNPSVRIYVNEKENKITFRIQTGYYVELVTPETRELLGSTKNIELSIKTVKMYLIQILLKQY